MASRTLTRALLLPIVALVVLVLAAGTAFADADGVPPVFGGGTGTPGDPGHGNPGGGSTGTPTPAPDGSHWFFDDWQVGPGNLSGKAYYPFNGGTFEVTWYCPARDVIGNDGDWLPTSAWIQFGLDDDGNVTTSILRGCRYPGKPVDVPITCAIKATVTITKVKGPLGDPNIGKTLKTVSNTSAWASDRSSVAKCEASEVAANAYIPILELGGYAVGTQATVVGCSKRVYDDGRAPKIVSCGDTFTRTGNDNAGMYCDGGKVQFDTSGTALNHAPWTWDSCTTKGGLMECTYDQHTPLFAGRQAGSKSVGVPDDGKMRSLWFGPLGVKGIIGQPTDVSARVYGSIDEISPSRDGEDFYGNQPFGTDPKAEPGKLDWTPGDTTAWPLTFLAPTNGGEQWVAHKESRFTAKVKVTIHVITQVDVYGNVTYGTETRTLTVRSACSSSDAHIAVSRARSSSGSL